MNKCVDHLHCLCEVPAHIAHQFKELILIETELGHPEGYVFVASGESRVGFKFSYLALAELPDEAGVLTPKQSDILYVKEFHGPSLEAKAKGPADFLLYILARIHHNPIVDHTWAKDL